VVSCLRLLNNNSESIVTKIFKILSSGILSSVTEYWLPIVSRTCLIFKGQWITVIKRGIDIIRGCPRFVVIIS
jgi:hypothetical protein